MLTNKDGYAVAYFDGDKGSVAFRVPKEYRGKGKASELVLTHVHPAHYDRTIGGGFSDADIINHIAFGFGETRAVSTEGVYSFKTTNESDWKGFAKALDTKDATVYRDFNTALASMKKAGYTLTSKEETDLFLRVSDAWYRNTAYKYGYEYRSPWG